ncbi:IS66-like element accessory protein TnpA [Pantoea dispersa]|uniref:IS66-like element accessory protein TnpA n=1 Tax=Pantoea dispersa TaxID=59814 RepID=UPI001CA5F6EB|nr:transposase [Pantoea dispersa]QZY97679.1 transposase [Pantoea dispersa]
MSDIHNNVRVGRRKGCLNYPPEFKQRLVAASCEPGISISKLALDNGINANLLFKWRQHWRAGKISLPAASALPSLLPVTVLPATQSAEQLLTLNVPCAVQAETPSVTCEVTLRNGSLRLSGPVNEKMLALLVQELK